MQGVAENELVGHVSARGPVRGTAPPLPRMESRGLESLLTVPKAGAVVLTAKGSLRLCAIMTLDGAKVTTLGAPAALLGT